MQNQQSALYDAWAEARLKEAEAQVKMLKAQKAAAAAEVAHDRASRAEREAFARWNEARLAADEAGVWT